MGKRALITGITGQDGSFLAELLLNKGYSVHGVIRRSSLENPQHQLKNLKNSIEKINLHMASVDSPLSLYKVIQDVVPTEVYHFAASSFVSYQFDDESSIFNTNFSSTHCLLSAIKEINPKCKFLLAGSSEMFGDATHSPQDETTPFNPRSIYGISKLASHHLVKNYRRQYGLFASTAVLYNHESSRRGSAFVTKKIANAAARIKMGIEKKVSLGNLDAQRDWGYAPDYMIGAFDMMQLEFPEDLVLATGKLHSVKDFVRNSFEAVGLNWENHVETNEKFYRASEAVPLCGNFTKAKEVISFAHSKSFESIILEMVEAEIESLNKR